MQVDQFYQYMLDLARYSHVPLCNITSTQNKASMNTFVSDVFLGRALQATTPNLPPQ